MILKEPPALLQQPQDLQVERDETQSRRANLSHGSPSPGDVRPRSLLDALVDVQLIPASRSGGTLLGARRARGDGDADPHDIAGQLVDAVEGLALVLPAAV